MAFSYKRTLTIDYTKVVGAANLTSFPVLVSLTHADLKTVANGGHVTSASGYDICFYAETGLTTKYDHEIESYNPTTGALVMWVEIPTVSYTANTVFYMGYGDSGITTSQETVTGTWNSNIKGVYHLRDGSTLSATDSTATAGNGTIDGATALSGKIGGGASFDGTNDKVTLTDLGLDMTAEWTVEMWVNRTDGSDRTVLGYGDGGVTPYYSWEVYYSSAQGTFCFKTYDGSSHNCTAETGNSTGTWYHLVVTHNAGTIYIYQNGAAIQSAGNTGHTTANRTDAHDVLYLGKATISAAPWSGGLDEVRFYNVAKTIGWVGTSYATQGDAAFLALGAEEAVGGGGGSRRIWSGIVG